MEGDRLWVCLHQQPWTSIAVVMRDWECLDAHLGPLRLPVEGLLGPYLCFISVNTTLDMQLNDFLSPSSPVTSGEDRRMQGCNAGSPGSCS